MKALDSLDSTPGRMYFMVLCGLSAAALASYYLTVSLLGGDAASGALSAIMLPVGTLLMVMLGNIGHTKDNPHAVAAIVASATTVMSTCFAGSVAMDSPAFLFIGFFVGVAAGVFGLIRELDEHVRPTILLFVSLAQMLLLISLIG